MNRHLKAVALALVATLAVGLAGCTTQGKPDNKSAAGGDAKATVTVSGSTALLPLVSAAKEAFEAEHANITVNVSGGGSFTGLNQVSTGAVDIGNSDVEAPPEMTGLVDHQVAIAPFLLVVNPSVTIDNLTEQQAIDILTGKIKNWSEVGGPDQAITVVSRPESSGSRATIKKIVLKGAEFTPEALIQDSNGKIFQAVKQTPGAIGYIDAAYLKDGVKVLKYNGVEYNKENVLSGKYPIFAYEHMYTKGEPQGAVKQFLDFILSPEFQEQYVEQMGFLPVK